MNIIATILLFTIILYWDLSTDKKKYDADPMKSKASVNHQKEWYVRVLLMVIPTIILVLDVKDFYALFFAMLSGGMALGFLYWILFDGIYNVWVLKEQFFDIIGTTSSLDQFQQRLGKREAVIFKFVGFILFSFSYFIVVQL